MNVIVRFRRSPGAAENLLIQGFGGGVRKQLKGSSRWMSVSLPANLVARLAEHSIVDFVAADEPVASALDIARQAANEAPVEVPESAFKGAGVTIAMVDSGVALHPDIATLVAAVDFVGGAPLQGGLGGLLPSGTPQTSPANSTDPNGHGTHVAGILVGSGSHSPNGRMAGVAPQANLVSVRVLDGTGRGLSSDVLAGLQWILENKSRYGIGVVNLSLGHPVYEPASVDPLVQAVDALWDAGIVVVCSAGNSGRDGYVTVSSPCNSRKVITVGAINDHRTPSIADDTTTTYSSRGPTAIDLVAKPDIAAPGNRIVSLRAPGSHQDMLFPDRRVAADPSAPLVREYFEMSGTSMASPIVAGTAALMLEQDPSLNPGTIKARLMLSARKPAVGDPLIVGAGSLDILAALRTNGSVANAPSPAAVVDTASGLIGFENPAVLWGNDSFSLMTLWPGSVIWTDPTAYYQPVVWTAGELWPASKLWPTSELWPESEFWPEGEMWPDLAEAWSAIRNTSDGLPIELSPLSLGLQDP
jgi:serine protease AprX